MQTSPARRLIGILGGMGPAATLDVMGKILAATPARVDEEHVPLIVHCVPQIPNRVEAVLSGSDAPLPQLLAGVRVLERAGVEAIAIACNTAHHWHSTLSAACGVPVLHITAAVRRVLGQAGAPPAPLGLMATRGTRAARIYDGLMEGGPCEGGLVMPDEAAQALIDAAILAVKAGDLPVARAAAEAAAARLAGEGAASLLLACTELPLALAASPWQPRLLDASACLARLCVAVSLGEARAQDVAMPGPRLAARFLR